MSNMLAPEELADLVIVTMARELSGDAVVGSATFCSSIAARVAKRTRDASILVMENYGLIDPEGEVTLTLGEFLGQDTAKAVLGQQEMFELVLTGRFRIWIQPSQLDRHGNANISTIGDFHSPTVALVGPRGLPDNSVHLPSMNYYVPVHSKRVFVENVDHICAVGLGEARRAGLVSAGAPNTVVTNLMVMRFNSEGSPQAVSLHPGVSPGDIKEATAFDVYVPEDVPTTEPPSPEERAVIQDVDPRGCRRLEFLEGDQARELRQTIMAAERDMWTQLAASGHTPPGPTR